MRDSAWLANELELFLRNYFSDVKLTNPIHIKFGREAQFRFGSIKLVKPRGISNFKFQISNLTKKHPSKSLITITSMFASEDIPADIVRYTIAHELCHYAHGFSSYNKRLFKFPHHGGIVNKELRARGLGGLISAYKTWLKAYRTKILSGRKIS